MDKLFAGNKSIISTTSTKNNTKKGLGMSLLKVNQMKNNAREK